VHQYLEGLWVGQDYAQLAVIVEWDIHAFPSEGLIT